MSGISLAGKTLMMPEFREEGTYSWHRLLLTMPFLFDHGHCGYKGTREFSVFKGPPHLPDLSPVEHIVVEIDMDKSSSEGIRGPIWYLQGLLNKVCSGCIYKT